MKKFLLITIFLGLGSVYAQDTVEEHVEKDTRVGTVATIKDMLKMRLGIFLPIVSEVTFVGSLKLLLSGKHDFFGSNRLNVIPLLLASYVCYKGSNWCVKSLSKEEYKELAEMEMNLGLAYGTLMGILTSTVGALPPA